MGTEQPSRAQESGVDGPLGFERSQERERDASGLGTSCAAQQRSQRV